MLIAWSGFTKRILGTKARMLFWTRSGCNSESAFGFELARTRVSRVMNGRMEFHAGFDTMCGALCAEHARKKQELAHLKQVEFAFLVFVQEGLQQLLRNASGTRHGDMRMKRFEVRFET